VNRIVSTVQTISTLRTKTYEPKKMFLYCVLGYCVHGPHHSPDTSDETDTKNEPYDAFVLEFQASESGQVLTHRDWQT